MTSFAPVSALFESSKFAKSDGFAGQVQLEVCKPSCNTRGWIGAKTLLYGYVLPVGVQPSCPIGLSSTVTVAKRYVPKCYSDTADDQLYLSLGRSTFVTLTTQQGRRRTGALCLGALYN